MTQLQNQRQCAAQRAKTNCQFHSVQNDPRETMRRIGTWAQPALTWLTGKALDDQEPMIRWCPTSRVTATVSQLAFGISGTWYATTHYDYWLLVPLGWLLTTGAARSLMDTLVHQASHGRLFSLAPRANDVVGDLLSILAFGRSLDQYRREHLVHHSALATTKDEDIKALESLGFKPGLSRRRYWSKLLQLTVSPIFHVKAFSDRLKSNLVVAPTYRKFAGVAFWGTVLVTVTAGGFWLPFLVSVVVPLIFGVHISSLLSALSEHRWIRVGEGRDSKRVVLARLTSGRFLGKAFPQRCITSKLLWIAHTPVWWVTKVAVWPSDSAGHDAHHLSPGKDRWWEPAYSRRDFLRMNEPGSQLLTEIWGLKQAIDATFALMASLPKSAKLGDVSSYDL